MAFALAIKSKFDLPRVGSIFFLLTLIVTAFTLIYSALFLETTLHKCDVILKEESNESKKQALVESNSDNNANSKRKVTFKGEEANENENEKEKIINHSFLHEDLDQYDNHNNYNNNNNKNEEFLLKNNYANKKNNSSSNYFVLLKEKAIKFSEDYLIPLVNRDERVSICSNYSTANNMQINLENVKMKDLKKKFMENKDDL